MNIEIDTPATGGSQTHTAATATAEPVSNAAATTGGAGAFAQMAKTLEKPAAPNKMANAPVSRTNTVKPNPVDVDTTPVATAKAPANILADLKKTMSASDFNELATMIIKQNMSTKRKT